MNPVVSIITPSFNRAHIVHETAESIFSQTYLNWEWVIVDDGSTDNSWELLLQYASKDSRVKIFQRNREPKGACTCRNIAVENCTGDYVLFLDTDDLLASFCLQQRIETMLQYPNADFVIFPMLLFKQKPDDLKLLWNIDKEQDDIERILTGDPVCQGTGTLWKKSSFAKVGMWNEQLLLWQDIELHLRSLLQNVQYVKRLDLKPDVFLRISDVSLSRTGYHSLPKLLSRMMVLKQTAGQIKHQDSFEIYRSGLKRMFTDIFMNAVNGGYKKQVEEMKALEKEWNLFNRHESKTMNAFYKMTSYKLLKIPVLQRHMQNRMLTLSAQYKSTIGTVLFTSTVEV